MSQSEDDHYIDNRLQLGYGSAWHVLRGLGWQRERFTRSVSEAIGVAGIDWLDFPVGGRHYYPTDVPIRDGEWKRLAFCDETLRLAYNKFWPARGEQQNWDIIGRAQSPEREWILVEAKGHADEIKFKGTTADETGGRPLIRDSFIKTLIACGISENEAPEHAEKWLTGCYQHANRIATLHFLRDRGIAARLVFLYFCGDQHPSNRPCPANAQQWVPTLKLIEVALGLSGRSMLEACIHNIFLNVNDFSVEVLK